MAALEERRDSVRPLLAAGTCFLIYWILWNLLIPPARFLGGEMVANTIPLLSAAAVASALSMMIFESRGLTDTGLSWGPGSGRNLLFGLGFGVGGALLMVLPCLAMGIAHYEHVSNADTSLGAALFFPMLLLCGAAGEEILFRGFMLQYLMRAYGAWAAIVGVAALFAVMHAGNPGVTTLGLLNTAGFGILFGAALLRTHELWLPIGAHFGWNATLPFLGVQLSGLTIRVTEYRLVWSTGDVWSGGSYGPEASVAASAVLVILFLLLRKLPVRRGWAYLLDSAPEPDTAQPVQD